MLPSLFLPLLLTASGAPGADAPLPAEPAVAPLAQDEEEVPEEEKRGWEGSITAGAIIQTGNTETNNITATGNAIWHGDSKRFTANALWNYQDDRTGVIQRKLYGDAQYDHFLTEKLYGYGKASADNDFQANLDLRWTAGAGAGYQFRDDDDWKLAGELGLAYVDENFADDMTVPDPDNSYLAARIGYNWEYLGNEYFVAGQTAEIFPSLENGDDVYSRADTYAKTNLTESIFLKLQWIWTYDNTPVPGNERSDHIYALTVGWSF